MLACLRGGALAGLWAAAARACLGWTFRQVGVPFGGEPGPGRSRCPRGQAWEEHVCSHVQRPGARGGAGGLWGLGVIQAGGCKGSRTGGRGVCCCPMGWPSEWLLSRQSSPGQVSWQSRGWSSTGPRLGVGRPRLCSAQMLSSQPGAPAWAEPALCRWPSTQMALGHLLLQDGPACP